MLDVQVGQHGYYTPAAGDFYYASVIEVTADVVYCKVEFNDMVGVVSFDRTTRLHTMGPEHGRLVLKQKGGKDDMTDDELRERLAEYAHEAWSGWMRYMFDNGGYDLFGVDGTQVSWVMHLDKYKRWQRQMRTPYADLPESEKASDRAEADKMLAILGKLQEATNAEAS